MARLVFSAFLLSLVSSLCLAAEDAVKENAVFLETFSDDPLERWTISEATKVTPSGAETFAYVGQWEVEDLESGVEADKGLVAKSKAAHHAISVPFADSISLAGDEDFVVQYEVKYRSGGNCGGGYVKLLQDGFQTSGKEFSDRTPWVIMFGPDLTCPGTKIHFIFRHPNPVTGEYEEKHLKNPPQPNIQKETNLYTLIVHPDNTFDILFNNESVRSGSLLEDFTPAVNPVAEIDDPEDSKPSEWVDDEYISDPDATKPEDWDEDAPRQILDEDAEKPEGWLDDEPDYVPDPDAEKPEEWDEEEDGDYIAPTIPNPKCEEAPGCGEWKRPTKANPAYKGKWSAPRILNPEYKGPWFPRKIANPEFFEDLTPLKSLDKIGGLGIELWTMTADSIFDNILITRSPSAASDFASSTWSIKKAHEEATKIAEAVKLEEDSDELIAKFPFNIVNPIREKVFGFIEIAKYDPVFALKAQPEVAVGLVVVILTLFGMSGTVLGILGSKAAPKAKAAVVKKTETPAEDKKTESSTTAVEEKESLKKRTTSK